MIDRHKITATPFLLEIFLQLDNVNDIHSYIHFRFFDSVDRQYFQESNTHTTCSWKGEASYFTIKVGDQVNPDAAWYYPAPKEAAAEIKDYVAFWKGVEIAV